MVKRGIWAVVIAATMAVAFAGPAAAGGAFNSYRYAFRCQHPNGGAFGAGFISSRAYIEENGRTGANYFKINFKWQQKAVDGSTGWFLAYSDAQKTITSTNFPNDFDSYYFDRLGKFSFHGAFDYTDYWNRLVITMEAWDDRSGPDVLLYRSVVRTPPRAC